MNLGQSMLALGALTLIGYLSLSSNRNIAAASSEVDKGNFGITAVALANSIAEEAMGKMFDCPIEDSTSGAFTNTSQLTPANMLGKGSTEQYHHPTKDFNDFDDFNNQFFVFKSPNSLDTVSTPGSTFETIVPNLQCKFFVKTKVTYVDYTNLDAPSNTRTWHKRLDITVINPTANDTLRYPVIMSYWN